MRRANFHFNKIGDATPEKTLPIKLWILGFFIILVVKKEKKLMRTRIYNARHTHGLTMTMANHMCDPNDPLDIRNFCR